MAKGRSYTTEKDLGISRVKALIEELKSNPHVKVGVLESAGTHKDEDGKPSGLTVANIAVFNEFGTNTIPARPAIRYSALILMEPMKALSDKILEGVVTGRLTIDTGLTLMGEKAKAEIKKVITDWDTPPNAPSTIKAKARKKGRASINAAGKKGAKEKEAAMSGFDNPLIDTSQYRNSIDYEKVRK